MGQVTWRQTTLCCSPGARLPRGIERSMLGSRAGPGTMKPSAVANKSLVFRQAFRDHQLEATVRTFNIAFCRCTLGRN